MGLDIDASDIAIAHRLKKGKRDVTRPIIVRLSNKRVRDKIFMLKNLFVSSKVKLEYIYPST